MKTFWQFTKVTCTYMLHKLTTLVTRVLEERKKPKKKEVKIEEVLKEAKKRGMNISEPQSGYPLAFRHIENALKEATKDLCSQYEAQFDVDFSEVPDRFQEYEVRLRIRPNMNCRDRWTKTPN